MSDVVARGVRFHVQRLGAGEQTVVFIHGLVMDNLSSWYFTLANPVAAFSEVVLYDLRGHGMSERPATGYALSDMVADLAGILDALSTVKPVTLIGNSFGALVAVAFAVAHPDRVAALVVVDGHLGEAEWGEKMAATLSLTGGARDRQILESFKSWLGRHSERKRTRLARNAQALVSGTSLVGDMRSSGSVSDADLRSLRCPILALYGDRSDVRDQGERLARLAPGCELRWIPGSTHSVIWEATALVREQVVSWLRSPKPTPWLDSSSSSRH
jgi:pimeloyl-ACP methyl ester carboxylesterase